MNSLRDTGALPHSEFPHSAIHGSQVIYTYPWLIAVNHGLRRRQLPRHPLYALYSLIFVLYMFWIPKHAQFNLCAFTEFAWVFVNLTQRNCSLMVKIKYVLHFYLIQIFVLLLQYAVVNVHYRPQFPTDDNHNIQDINSLVKGYFAFFYNLFFHLNFVNHRDWFNFNGLFDLVFGLQMVNDWRGQFVHTRTDTSSRGST